MKRDAETCGTRTRCTQQHHRIRRFGAEFSGQVQHCAAFWQREPNDQTKIARNAARREFIDDLGELIRAVEREVPHVVTNPGLPDRAARFDRVHEMDLRVREHLPHQQHLAWRSAVEMPNAAGPQCLQYARLGVALDGIKNIARKRGGESGAAG